MAKKRTRKQKIQAKHPFLISWEEGKKERSKASLKAGVKRQSQKTIGHKSASKRHEKSTHYSAEFDGLASVKKDIIKSLSIASLIVGIEIVLYLIW
jgi:hypothetical protein